MSDVEFFFDYRSPYSYLAHIQLVASGAAIVYRPFDIVDLKKRGAKPATSVASADEEREAQESFEHGDTACGALSMGHTDGTRFDARRLLRASLAAASFEMIGPAVAALFRARWVQPVPLENAEQIAQVFGPAGLGAYAIEPMIDSQAMDEALDRSTILAQQRGVVGAPTMCVDGELYVGNERPDFMWSHMRKVR